MDPLVTLGLLGIFVIVLVLPFKVRVVEKNLEIFLFFCGVVALTIAGFASIPGEITGWNGNVVVEALLTPVDITHVAGIPVGIVQIVLFAGLGIYILHRQLQDAITGLVERVSLNVTVPLLIIILGLVSSLISAILAAIILAEIVNVLPIGKESKVELVVIACFSIGLGAGLTPLGEPLSTIVIAKLAGKPYHADFLFLVHNIGVYILPAVFLLGVFGLVLFRRSHSGDPVRECIIERETLPDVVIRAGKVYLFIIALVFLGEGFKPLILEYLLGVPSAGLYWVNIVSAVLDNATLAAAEISPALTLQQINGALIGLLVAGGMLIPGNIPNIIAAGKLQISSREWAGIGLPLGLILMLVLFLVFFVPRWIGIT